MRKQLIVIVMDTLEYVKLNRLMSQTHSFIQDSIGQVTIFTESYPCQPCYDADYASILTGMYPHKHGVYHKGMKIRQGYQTFVSRLRKKNIRIQEKEMDFSEMESDYLMERFIRENKGYDFCYFIKLHDVPSSENTFNRIYSYLQRINQMLENKRQQVSFLMVTLPNNYDIHTNQCELLKAPIILSGFHGIEPGINQELISHVDIPSTILKFFGQADIDTLQGQSIQSRY